MANSFRRLCKVVNGLALALLMDVATAQDATIYTQDPPTVSTLSATAKVKPSTTACNTCTAALTPKSINGIVNATQYPGSDIGAQVNAAMADVSNCGQIMIPPGAYRWSTPVVKQRCVRIVGASAGSTVLTYTGASGCAITIADHHRVSAFPSLSSENTYPPGGMDDISLVGSGHTNAAIGLCIGDKTLVNYADHQNFNRMRWSNWGTAIEWGNHAFNTTIFESVITNNGTGIHFPNGLIDSGESLNVIETSIQNNMLGINTPGYADVYFSHDRCDYNTQCGIVAIASFVSCHFEQSGGRILTVHGVPQESVQIIGGWAQYAALTGSDPDMFYIDSVQNPSFSIQGTFILAKHNVSNFINWHGSGGDEVLNIGPLPRYETGSNAIVMLTNAHCVFSGCSINDGHGNLSYYSPNASLSTSGDVSYSTLTTTQGGLGARIGNVAGFADVQGNRTGLRLDPTNGNGNTPIYLTNGYMNATGVTARFSGLSVATVATLTTTSKTSDVVSVSGATALSHCWRSATNALAAANESTTYVSAKGLNEVTVTHAAVAGMTFDLGCTVN